MFHFLPVAIQMISHGLLKRLHHQPLRCVPPLLKTECPCVPLRACLCLCVCACMCSLSTPFCSIGLCLFTHQHPLPLLRQPCDKFWCLPTLFFKIKLIILELLHFLQDSESASQLDTHTHTHTHTHKAVEILIGIASNLSVNLGEDQHLYNLLIHEPSIYIYF